MIRQNELYSECKYLKQHNSLSDFYNHLAHFIDKLGFDQYLYTALPVFYRSMRNHTVPVILVTTYDQSWTQYYLDKRYDLHDRAFLHCLSDSDNAFVWHRDFKRGNPTTLQTSIVRQAAEVGIEYGFTIPLKNCTGVLGILSATFKAQTMADSFDLFYGERKTAIEIFAYAFNEAIIEKFATRFARPYSPNLTARETEVLKWLSSGCSYECIADKLTIGCSTVRKHISSMLKKLQARNSTHACALAIRWGIIK